MVFHTQAHLPDDHSLRFALRQRFSSLECKLHLILLGSKSKLNDRPFWITSVLDHEN